MTAPLPLKCFRSTMLRPSRRRQSSALWPLPAPGRSEGERAEIEAPPPSARYREFLRRDGRGDYRCGWQYAGQPGCRRRLIFHARFGGVVPEIASRKHVEVIVSVVDAALEDAAASLGLTGGAIAPSELAAVGVTQGPGLVGALVVGVAFAKGFAYAAGKPPRVRQPS